jgi:hypothetical protein
LEGGGPGGFDLDIPRKKKGNVALDGVRNADSSQYYNSFVTQ